MTRSRWAGFFTGLAVTAAVQSSSAAMVMVVGFVNSGLLTLGQAVGVIMGTNVGTTVTPWLLSLGGLEGGGFLGRLLRPAGFVPLLSLWGIIAYLSRNGRRRDTGQALLGFATLMQGMELMSGSVAGLAQAEGFRRLFTAFTDPLLGLLAGAVLTAVIQSSSASVGILQALAASGQVTVGAAVPIIMGQNIGTCITAMLSSVGASRNARRAALVHLLFNLTGAGVWLAVFWVVKVLAAPTMLARPVTLPGVAVIHTAFNLLCTMLLFPAAGLLERAVLRLLPGEEGRRGRSWTPGCWRPRRQPWKNAGSWPGTWRPWPGITCAGAWLL
ncbi:MAG: Na/Pi cotransporter family protein [Oscillospiraceae bacterium]